MKTNDKLDLKSLNLPDDVIENSGQYIDLYGNITGENNEIIVLFQLGREVLKGYVCYEKRPDSYIMKELSSNVQCSAYNIIDYMDMEPDIPILVIQDHMRHIVVHEFNGVNYTMFCISDKGNKVSFANWLH